MLSFDWLTKLLDAFSNPTDTKKKAPSFHPELEPLEARALPSTTPLPTLGYESFQNPSTSMEQHRFDSGDDGSYAIAPMGTGDNIGIFGADTRTPVSNVTSYPFRAVGRLRITWRDGTTGSCSGALVGPYHVLTAGHCVYSASKGGWARTIQFIPGSKGDIVSGTSPSRADYQYYGEANAVYMRSYSGWTSSRDFNHDFALVTLDRRVGNYTGYFGYGYNTNTNWYLNQTFNTAGYPGDKMDSNGDGFRDNYDMYYTSGRITSATNYLLRSNQMDVYGGQSGSPVWVKDGSNRYIHGVVSHTTYQTISGVRHGLYNGFVRLTQNKFNSIGSWISTDNVSRTPTDRPDLVSYDNWFDTNLSSISSNFSSTGRNSTITTLVRNNGTRSAGSFRVSFYASTNTTITSSDYLLGSTTVSNLNPFQSRYVSWTGSMPSNLPSGRYYIGWRIDSGGTQSEFDESNNTGYLSNRVTVDTSRPVVTLFSSVASLLRSGRPITVTANVSEGVSGFSSGDLVTNNATVSNFRWIGGNSYSFELTPNAKGQFSVYVRSGAVQDGAGNSNFSSNLLSRRFEPRSLFAVGADAGGGPHVQVFDSLTGQTVHNFFPYDPRFTGGVRVALGDINGDGVDDIITAPGLTGGPHVKVYDGDTGAELRSFFAFDPGFRGGITVASGDIDNDGYDDILVGAGPGGGPHVRVFSGFDNREMANFFPYAQGFRGGVQVASGDLDRDGYDEIIIGAGAGGGPHVRAYSGRTRAIVSDFFAFDQGFRGGVYLGSGDVDGDGYDDIIVGAGAGGGPHVRTFSGRTRGVLADFFAYDAGFLGGVRVGASDRDGDGIDEILLAAGPGGGPHVRSVSVNPFEEVDSFFAYDPRFTGGIFVA